MKKSKKIHPLQHGLHAYFVNEAFAEQIASGELVVVHNGFEHPRPTPPKKAVGLGPLFDGNEPY